ETRSRRVVMRLPIRRGMESRPRPSDMQRLIWANLRWENNDPLTAHYVCAQCGVVIVAGM
ncbi:MAG: hypothetical protein ACREMA_10735, partial [Longimicrobiales bacterium]